MLFFMIVAGAYKKHINRENPLGSKGVVTESFADLTNALWTSKEKTVAPSRFKVQVAF